MLNILLNAIFPIFGVILVGYGLQRRNIIDSSYVRTANQVVFHVGIPAMLHEECLMGWQAKGATIFPQAIGLASTWEPDLVKAMADVIREEMVAVGARQTLALLLGSYWALLPGSLASAIIFNVSTLLPQFSLPNTLWWEMWTGMPASRPMRSASSMAAGSASPSLRMCVV